jgi:hypothetical protein
MDTISIPILQFGKLKGTRRLHGLPKVIYNVFQKIMLAAADITMVNKI